MEITLKNFVTEIYNFLQTVTIFNPYSVTRYQEIVMSATGLTAEDIPLEKNPYILNLLGIRYNHSELHPESIYTGMDTPIINITSHDTGTVFELDRETLANHPNTLNNYRISKNLRDTLYLRYPEHSHFIRACFFQVEETDLLVRREDPITHILLPPELVNKDSFYVLATGAEYTLPERERVDMAYALTQFIRYIDDTCNVDNYIQHEKYGALVFESWVLSLCPMVLFKQRIKNINTSKAHKDLIWLYLTSKGLKDYRDVFSDEQELFLYKNFRYLKATKGSRATIKAILFNLLQLSGLDLVSKYIMVTDKDLLLNYTGTPVLVNSDIRSKVPFAVEQLKTETESISHFFQRELRMGLETTTDLHNETYQEDLFRFSKSTRLPTKVLELVHPKYSLRESVAYLFFALETLYYLYTVLDTESFVVRFTPKDSYTELSLNVREALALLFYSELQHSSPTFSYTEKNYERYLGVICICDGIQIKITQTNYLSYVNTDLVFIGPTTLPTSAIFNKPFIPEATYPSTFSYRGGTYSTAEYIAACIRNRSVPATPSKETITEYLRDEFNTRLTDVVTMEDFQDAVVNQAYNTVYRDTVCSGSYDLDWGETLSSTTIEEWLNEESQLPFRELFEKMNVSETRSQAYADLMETLIKAIIDEGTSGFLKIYKTSEIYAEVMGEILKQLGTYDISLINTKEEAVEESHSNNFYFDNASPIETLEEQFIPLTEYLRETSVLDSTENWDETDNMVASDGYIEPDQTVSSIYQYGEIRIGLITIPIHDGFIQTLFQPAMLEAMAANATIATAIAEDTIDVEVLGPIIVTLFNSHPKAFELTCIDARTLSLGEVDAIGLEKLANHPGLLHYIVQSGMGYRDPNYATMIRRSSIGELLGLRDCPEVWTFNDLPEVETYPTVVSTAPSATVPFAEIGDIAIEGGLIEFPLQEATHIALQFTSGAIAPTEEDSVLFTGGVATVGIERLRSAADHFPASIYPEQEPTFV